MDGEHGAAVVVGAAEGELELQRVDLALDAGDVLGNLGRDGAVVLVGGEREELGGFRGAPLQAPPGLDLVLTDGEALEERARAVGVIPEGGRGSVAL